MKKIWKFPLSTAPTHLAVMPAGAEILHVKERDNFPCIWALVDTRQTVTERRTFHIVQTGDDIPADAGRYIGTVHLHNGTHVLHVFGGQL